MLELDWCNNSLHSTNIGCLLNIGQEMVDEMKLYDPNGSNKTIEVETSKQELEAQIIARYKDEAKQQADKIKGKSMNEGIKGENYGDL